MISKEMEFMAEGIKMLIERTQQRVGLDKATEWLEKYSEIFPKKIPFGGPINKEDDTY